MHDHGGCLGSEALEISANGHLLESSSRHRLWFYRQYRFWQHQHHGWQSIRWWNYRRLRGLWRYVDHAFLIWVIRLDSMSHWRCLSNNSVPKFAPSPKVASTPSIQLLRVVLDVIYGLLEWGIKAVGVSWHIASHGMEAHDPLLTYFSQVLSAVQPTMPLERNRRASGPQQQQQGVACLEITRLQLARLHLVVEGLARQIQHLHLVGEERREAHSSGQTNLHLVVLRRDLGALG